MTALMVAAAQVNTQPIEPSQGRLDDLGEMPGRLARRLEELEVSEQGLDAAMAGAEVGADEVEDHLAPHGAALILIPDEEVGVYPGLQRVFLEKPGAEGMNGRDRRVGKPGQGSPPIDAL